jgi:transcriptional regulator with XRE-family HTH domain
MTSDQLKLVRLRAGMTQDRLAARLGVSQPYLSLLETGARRVPEHLARSAARVLHASPAVLPVPAEPKARRRDFSRALAALGYPGYSHLRGGRPLNPALAVFEALSQASLDARVAQGLPWVLLKYPELDWDWLERNARLRNLQNKLGFLVAVARRVAERSGQANPVAVLTAVEQALESSRLAAETTLGKEAMPLSEKVWLRANRPRLAEHWNVLTSLSPEHLPYAA